MVEIRGPHASLEVLKRSGAPRRCAWRVMGRRCLSHGRVNYISCEFWYVLHVGYMIMCVVYV
jgi:hypothetical protein